jgi:hypothetical protein
MTLKYRDNAFSTLELSINSSVTTIKPVSISSFPNPSRGDFSANSGDFFYLSLEKSTGDTEVVKVTDINANAGTFTVSRGYGTGTSTTFSAGDIVQLRMSSAILGDHVANTYLTKNYDSNSNTVSNTYLTAQVAGAFGGVFVTNTYIENSYFDRTETANTFASKTFVAQNYYDKASGVSNTYLKTIGFASNAYAASNVYVQRYMQKANTTVFLEKANSVPAVGGTFTGSINTQHILNTAHNVYDIGQEDKRFRNMYANGVFGVRLFEEDSAGGSPQRMVANAFLTSTYYTQSYINTNFYNNSTAVSNTYLSSAGLYNALSKSSASYHNLNAGLATSGLLSANGTGIPFEINSTDNTARKIRFEESGTLRGYIRVDNTYPLYVEDGSGNFEFYVENDGDMFVRGDITAFASDERLKDVTGGLPDALSKVKSLSGFTYTWNENAPDDYDKDKELVGVSAQAVQSVLPQIVSLAPFDKDTETGESISGENYLTLSYDKLVPLLIEAVKELAAKVDELENK